MSTDYFSAAQAADYLGLSPFTLQNYRSAGTGPAFHKFGSRVLYRRDDLDAWALAQRKVTSSEVA